MTTVANILYLHETAQLSGAEHSLLGLIANLEKERFRAVVACPDSGAFVDKLMSLGVKTYPVEFPPVRRIAGVALTVHKVREIIRDENVSIVHSNSIRTHICASLSARPNKIPVVWHERNMLDMHKEIIDPDRIFAFLSDAIICNSHAVAERFMKNGKLPDKVRAIYNGVDIIRFNPAVSGDAFRKKFNISGEDIVIGISGRFNKIKGHETFFSAAEQLLREMPGLHQRLRFLVVGGVVFGGDKEREDYLKGLVKKLRIEDRVIFTGAVENIEEAYAAMDIVVLASVLEACGRVILEAMASGKPVVGTRSGGTPEIIEDRVSGFLFNAGDAKALADHIVLLADNPDLVKNMGKAGRRRIEENFSIEKNVRQIQDVYTELLRNE